ncbi:sigma-54-dependent Fis family transcriptional regulator [bacterium]|nr:sigma-54-dependent Fis family transcriptional regulator [bacterium]
MKSANHHLNLLFLDDDPFLRDRVKSDFDGAEGFDGRKYFVTVMASSQEARHFVERLPHQDDFVALIDLSLDGTKTSGIDVIRYLRGVRPAAPILAFSDFDDPETVKQALQAGASDFISKRTEGRELVHRINMAGNVLQHAAHPRRDLDNQPLVTPTMQTIARRAARIVPSAVSSVLVYGESGTGKEVVADVFAEAVGKSVPFLRVNCGSISPSLIESELFGHVRGAFTGAATDRRGYFESANGGWVFLDEVATLTATAQVALLRVLENHEIVRVGSSKSVNVEVRVMAATNERLDLLVANGRFRKDLWQRLREVEIDLPPLRQRQSEIPGLVTHFCKTMPGGPYEVTDTVMDVLATTTWHDGNVRELRNCLRAMTEFATPDRRLTPLALPKWLLAEAGADAPDQEAGIRMSGGAFTASGASTLSRELRVDIPETMANPYQFEDICDLALVALVRGIFKERGKVSLRSLSRLIGLSRGTLTTKLRGAADKGLVGMDEIQSLFAIQARED